MTSTQLFNQDRPKANWTSDTRQVRYHILNRCRLYGEFTIEQIMEDTGICRADIKRYFYRMSDYLFIEDDGVFFPMLDKGAWIKRSER